jgi:hypothetical protein
MLASQRVNRHLSQRVNLRQKQKANQHLLLMRTARTSHPEMTLPVKITRAGVTVKKSGLSTMAYAPRLAVDANLLINIKKDW